MSNAITQGFMVNGQVFATKAEAEAFIRVPLVTAALNGLTGKNAELVKWLLENQQDIMESFECTKIKRVTKVERKALNKALGMLKDLMADSKTRVAGLEFLSDNTDAISDSFRWPAVKRESAEEQAATMEKTFLELTEGNAELATWLQLNKDQLAAAYAAGVEKREVSAKAIDALAAYRAAKDAGPEALEKYQAEKAAEKAAKAAAKAAA